MKNNEFVTNEPEILNTDDKTIEDTLEEQYIPFLVKQSKGEGIDDCERRVADEYQKETIYSDSDGE